MQAVENEITKCYRVYGIVQGVGFRPTVSRHAASCGIRGSVSNKGPYVEIYAQGDPDAVARFRRLVEEEAPVRSFILSIEEVPVTGAGAFERFDIVESAKTKGAIYISPDIAICETCKKELYDPKDRRYLHPFINCTCCGPRLTILDALPYDRERTSMKEFPMCPQCAAEYEDPASRRYDAQPVCCHDCGPDVYLIGRKERGREAITYTRKVIRNGGIAAIKGIGGFHLCCDAENEEAVMLLRSRKKRPMKPFAVMTRNMETARAACEISDTQAQILDGHQKPILLLMRREGAKICNACAPDNPKIGLMLPYAPLHLLLFDYDDGIQMPDYLVMTSANASGAPICRDDADAVSELSGLCDVMLSHERKIRIRADDTVMDFYHGEPYMVRRSRGYAPLPLMVTPPDVHCSGQQEKRQSEGAARQSASAEASSVLAIGGELKNTFCVGTGGLFYLSPYVGDLEDIRTVAALKETTARFETLLEVTPSVIACDMHPLYHSVETAREMVSHSAGAAGDAADRSAAAAPVSADCGLLQVQHHYAHVLSCMAENDALQEAVIGISFDGTGYGTDGTIWGGEFLLSDMAGFQRAACVRPFAQIGGDAGVREGWRIAAGLICQLYPDSAQAADIMDTLSLCTPQEARVMSAMVRRGVNAVRSTSCGRLFDAAAAILGIRLRSTFEGEAATALQFSAMDHAASCHAASCRENRGENAARKNDGREENGHGADARRERFAKITDAWDPARKNVQGCIELPTDTLIRELITARCEGAGSEEAAWQFHRTLADLTVKAALRIREETQVGTVALTGGVFQNTLLLEMCDTALTEAGFRVLKHHLVPPNDGGIALGQAVYAAYGAAKPLAIV